MAKYSKGLGLLRDMGAAGLHHVQFVARARKLPPGEVSGELARYVQGLSEPAFRGFKLTLLAMARREANPETKAFLDSLHGACDAARAGKPVPEEVVARQPKEGPAASFESDQALVASWESLPERQWRAVLDVHLDGLSLAHHETFVEHVQELCELVSEAIEEHKADENRAWGGFVEDRMSYMMASLRTGAKDPEWVRRLREFEAGEALCQAVRETTYRRLAARRQEPTAPEPAPPAPAPAEDPVAVMRAQLDKGLAEGMIRPERQGYFQTLLDQMSPLMRKFSDPATSLGDKTALLSQFRGLADDFSHAFADPGPADRTAAAQPGSRAAVLERHIQSTRAYLMRELTRTPAEHTAAQAGRLLGAVGSVQRSLEHVTEDHGAVLQEQNLLRATAAGIRQYAHREHLMLARPVWESSDYVAAQSSIFYSGRPDLGHVLRDVCEPLLLTVHDNSRVQYHGQVRWDDLNSCGAGVYDLRGWRPGLSGPEALPLATVAYELGLAFAMGRPTVVVAGEDDDLPFDIDVSPCLLTGDSTVDRQALTEALDDAMYGTPPTSDASSLAATLEYLNQVTANHPKRGRFEGSSYLDRMWLEDPVGFEGVIKQLLRDLPETGLRLIRPRWPGSYPKVGDRRRCFHVMPFGSPWSDSVRDSVRAACGGIAEYQRGDEADDGRIIRGIWLDICRADVVLVDLTDLNLNVLIELGLAHALGRKTVLVRRAGAGELPRNIAKIRVHDYADADDLRKRVLPKWLAAAVR